MVELDELFAGLSRRPDIEAPDLVAVDAADRLVLDVAGPALDAALPGTVVVIDDRHGALTLGAAVAHGANGIRVHQDELTGELALARNAARVGLAGCYRRHSLDAALLDGAGLVLLRFPRSLAQLTEIAEVIARYARPDVTVVAGGRDKYLTPAMNEVLARSFRSVQPTRGRQKSRVVVAAGTRPSAVLHYPAEADLPELGLRVVSHGAVFGGSRLDRGTRFLLNHLDRMAPDAGESVDLGCGSGILAAALALDRPGLKVVATDQSAAAVASAVATTAANGLGGQVCVRRDDAMSEFPDAAADLIVCNPPFHVQAAVHTGTARKMFRAAGRVLRPGGELWTVYNGHLRYRDLLWRSVGPTDVIARSSKFVVTRSVRNHAGNPPNA